MKKFLPIIIGVILVIAGGAYLLTKNKSSSTSGSSSYPYGQSSNTSGSSSNNQSSAPVATDKVTISNYAFSPASITVKKGTTVTWTNKDSTAHTVTETDGKDGPKSGNLDNGQSYSFTFNTAGTYSYHCTFHAYMTGTVTVTE